VSDTLVPLAHERAVIGCVLAGHAAPGDTGPLPAEHFGAEAHRLVWQAIRDLDAMGHSVDHLTVAERLKERGELVAVGGPGVLMQWDASLPAGWNLPAYVATVAKYAGHRHLMAESERLRRAAQDLTKEPNAIAAEASGRLVLLDTKNTDELGDVDLHEINDRWDRYANLSPEEQEAQNPYLPVPWDWMREAGVRGFPASLSVVAGRSGIGKTATLSTCMAYWLQALPHHGGVIGLEDGTVWLDERWIARYCGLDYADVGTARLNEWQAERYADFYSRVGPLLHTKLRKYRKAGMTAAQLLARCKRWIDQGVRWIVIDHGLRVDYETDGRAREDRIIGKTMDALANLALNTRTHIIVAWHLNRANDDDAQPTLGDLKESGYLDAAARLIFGAWRKGDRTLLTVVKATKVAPVGLTCQLEWAGRSGMFDPKLGRAVDFKAEAEAARAQADAQRQASKNPRLFG